MMRKHLFRAENGDNPLRAEINLVLPGMGTMMANVLHMTLTAQQTSMLVLAGLNQLKCLHADAEADRKIIQDDVRVMKDEIHSIKHLAVRTFEHARVGGLIFPGRGSIAPQLVP